MSEKKFFSDTDEWSQCPLCDSTSFDIMTCNSGNSVRVECDCGLISPSAQTEKALRAIWERRPGIERALRMQK